ncbi:hypothetical protein ACVWZK_005966 [Bradyrhizobium sp. GM0.4]
MVAFNASKLVCSGDALDQRDDVADLLRALGQRTGGVAGAAGVVDGAGRDLGGLGHLTADLRNRRGQLLGGARDRLHVARCLL